MQKLRRSNPLAGMSYAAAQGARIAWYVGHYLAVDRLRGPLTAPGEEPFRPKGKLPGRDGLIAGMRALFERDWRNIEQGIYLPPPGMPRNPARALERSLQFFRDVPEVDRRRMRRGHSEVVTADRRENYPRYYLQNFHYQTDGWLSERSAKIYDTQVEVLFTGTADAMRRQALVPLRAALKDCDQRHMRFMELACGTGRFLESVKENYPRLNVTALDLSPAYLGEARKKLRPWRSVSFVQAPAEDVPLGDASQHIVACIYLFHELPPKVRRAVAREVARLLKPGGTFILVDALQTGDEADYDGLLEFFPVGFHEPYFASYLVEDFASLFGAVGLTLDSVTPAFLSKVMVFSKPAGEPPDMA